ncbi:hypothetical protein [Cupriavidus necator]|uniref:hypothetical protein n=1 Tax=Cupriavidus necator TaxID=106590 RepID=UPI0005B3A965|nr:hypothetical protein [Cupriavidus necator]
MLTFAVAIHAAQVMTTCQKITLPDIAREGLTPKELEVLAWVEGLVDMANGLQQEKEQLEQELAELRRAAKRA